MTGRNIADHMVWAVDRALEYVDRGDLDGALSSLFSDLCKYEGHQVDVAGYQPHAFLLALGEGRPAVEQLMRELELIRPAARGGS